MDDEAQYGPEFHRMTFSDAVEQNLLSDYKVLVLNIDQGAIAPALQNAIAAGNDKDLPLDDAARLVGCASALFDPEPDKEDEQKQLLRAIAFTRIIKDSKRIKDNWEPIVNESKLLLSETAQMRQLSVAVDHVDGGMNALERARKLDWLRASEEDEYEVRVLSNARCLTEGVDVPALDAVLFMQPRRSLVDVVQAVGRVMRKAPNKKFGYIILPIVIPVGVSPEDALNDNERYRVVWEVLQALRSHDERLDAEINKIDLNRAESGGGHINVIGVGGEQSDDATDTLTAEADRIAQYQLPGLVIDAFRAKVVEKVGDRKYWDRWAKDVADIATRIETRIDTLIPNAGEASNGDTAQVRLHFDSLLDSMRATTNDALTEDGAISIVAQHMITEPVFQTLFPHHDFAKSNPVANSLNQFVGFIRQHGLEAELESLDPFYASIRLRAEGLDNAEARRKVLEELYENFFKNALPKEARRLGVVYTPHEIVDFILNSTDYLLRKEFGKSFSDEGVHILDPFAGMGTFVWRLLANPDLIRDEDLERKFWEELHANEILPLAYYMASINVEETFRERIEARDKEDPGYLAFEGMVWRDTFNALTKATGQQSSMQFMQENDKRAKQQDDTNISVIISNPPYSAGQRNATDSNPNVSYPLMHDRIRETYGRRSRATLRQNLVDHYKLAIRWATDRISPNGGIIGFVTNASFLDANVDSGLRASLTEECTSIHVLNLRGDARTSGEIRRKEKGNVFGQETRTPIAITFLVNNPRAKQTECKISYFDIGDYLSRDEKLCIVDEHASINSIPNWVEIIPDKYFDWISQRDSKFSHHMPLGDESQPSESVYSGIFKEFGGGISTNKDPYVYDPDSTTLSARAAAIADVYMDAVERLASGESLDKATNASAKTIKWDDTLKARVKSQRSVEFAENNIRPSSYRPFFKMHLYFDEVLISRMGKSLMISPDEASDNIGLVVTGVSGSNAFSALVTDEVPNLHLISSGQCFPRFSYQSSDTDDPLRKPNISSTRRSTNDKLSYSRQDNIRDEALATYQSNYQDASITKDDIFYYVYGLLHSPIYKERYQNNLRRELPYIPLAPDFWSFSKAGRTLSDLHLNYESCEEYALTEERKFTGNPQAKHYQLSTGQMSWTDNESRCAIRVNDYFTLGNIPPDAHRYVVNGRTPLEWILDRYHIKTDKPSGIVHDPNKWFEETGDNIISMIKRITHTSIQTARVIDTLPTPFTDGWTPN